MSRAESTKDTIQPKYQPDPESLVDSIAFGPVSKVEAWNDKLQIMKDHTPASCDKARELYKGIASGIKGERRWKSPGRRMDAAKALMLSDKLQWIPEKCNPKAGKKKKSRTKRHAAKSHKMKRKHKQQSKRKHKQQSKQQSKYTRKMNIKTNDRRKTRRRNTRRTRRRNIRRTKKRMMGGDVVSAGVYPSGDLISREGEILMNDDSLEIAHISASGRHKKSKITSVTRSWWVGYGNGYKITTDGTPSSYWVPCEADGRIDGLDQNTFDALMECNPRCPEPGSAVAAEPEPEPEPESEPEPEPAAPAGERDQMTDKEKEEIVDRDLSLLEANPTLDQAISVAERMALFIKETNNKDPQLVSKMKSTMNMALVKAEAIKKGEEEIKKKKAAEFIFMKLREHTPDLRKLQQDLETEIFNLKLKKKEFNKLATKAKKKEKKERAEIKKAIGRRDQEVARVHAENAVRRKNEALDAERGVSKIAGQIATLELIIQQHISAQTMASATSKLHDESRSTKQDLENIESILNEADEQGELLKRGLKAAQQSGDIDETDLLLELVKDELKLEAAEKKQSEAEVAELQARIAVIKEEIEKRNA